MAAVVLIASLLTRDNLPLFAEAECCVGEAAGEACWEPCYCVLLQDEQTLTAYRSEDMAVSRDPFSRFFISTRSLAARRGKPPQFARINR